jgi:uncharacterized protein (UPF0548 family)
MWKLIKPNDLCLCRFLAQQIDAPFSYSHLGATAQPNWPNGYDHDRNRICLGNGPQVFEAACQALRQWRHFPQHWTKIFAADAPIEVGTTVAMVANVYRQWWINACRIVYLVDESTGDAENPVRRFGFAYGTLHEHVESGEERFLVEQLADGSVWYDLRAFSRPRLWCARLAYSLVRRLQRRFVRDSQQAMKVAVASRIGSHESDFSIVKSQI